MWITFTHPPEDLKKKEKKEECSEVLYQVPATSTYAMTPGTAVVTIMIVIAKIIAVCGNSYVRGGCRSNQNQRRGAPLYQEEGRTYHMWNGSLPVHCCTTVRGRC